MKPRVWLTLDVGSVEVPVVLRPRTEAEREGGTLAEYDRERSEIWIGDDLPKRVTEAALIHEIAHAVIGVFGIPTGDHDAEERTVSLVAGHVFDVLTRNGMLVVPRRPR